MANAPAMSIRARKDVLQSEASHIAQHREMDLIIARGGIEGRSSSGGGNRRTKGTRGGFEGQCNQAKSGGARLESKGGEKKVELLVLVPQRPTWRRGAHHNTQLSVVALHATPNNPLAGFSTLAPPWRYSTRSRTSVHHSTMSGDMVPDLGIMVPTTAPTWCQSSNVFKMWH
ncbi:hypothetical protein Scep_014141 [Stephania cephalantha]|uniref:Uncharacterized protein n=1 Tax=Stephania cephalantha TaxID=152367 RepID=A0AAP0J208_9MAGN